MRNNTKQRVVLCIMDGWGINKNSNHNAVALAKTPNVDYLTINLITKSTSPEQILNFVKQTLEKIN